MKLAKLLIHSLYSNKVFYQSLITYVFMTIFFLFIGNVFTSIYIQTDNYEAFRIDYLYQGILFIKLLILVQIIIYVFQIHQTMDLIILKVIEHTRLYVIIVTTLCIIGLVIIHLTVLYILYVINGLYLTTHFEVEGLFSLYLRLLLFSSLWTMIMLVMHFITFNIYTVLSIFLFYLFMVMFNGFLIYENEISLFIKITSLYVSDLLLYHDFEYAFLYSDLLVLTQFGSLFILLIWRFNRIDLK